MSRKGYCGTKTVETVTLDTITTVVSGVSQGVNFDLEIVGFSEESIKKISKLKFEIEQEDRLTNKT